MSAEAALQRAIYATLAPAVSPVKVFDRVTSDEYPRITIGDDQALGESYDCVEFTEIFARIHVWSRAVGKMEAKALAGQVRAALESAPEVTGYHVQTHEFRDVRYLEDPDGLTTHGAMTFRFVLYPDA